MKPVVLKFAAFAAAIVLLSPVAALAGHGRPGLWTVTSSMTMLHAPQIPPEVLAMMKKRGMPGMGEPITSQICMTREQVNADKPPEVNRPGMQCSTKVLNESASSVTAETTCHGRMEGVGRTHVDWRGDSHYEGSYTFKGTMEGRPNEMTTHYSGDFVKSDCGTVRPFGPPPDER